MRNDERLNIFQLKEFLTIYPKKKTKNLGKIFYLMSIQKYGKEIVTSGKRSRPRCFPLKNKSILLITVPVFQVPQNWNIVLIISKLYDGVTNLGILGVSQLRLFRLRRQG